VNRNELLAALRDVDGLPDPHKGPKHRNIYEAGEGPRLKASGRFYMDYAAYPGGSAEEIPLALIQELEREGLIERESPTFQSWVLTDKGRGAQ
jgi:hypothetical protein